MLYKHLSFFLAGFCLLFAGLFVHHVVARHHDSVSLRNHQVRQSDFSSISYRFINPLLICGGPGAANSSEYQMLSDRLQKYIDEETKRGTVRDVSVYFDTRDGRAFSIHPAEQYSPGSLMKVLTMIAVLKTEEASPGFLAQKITYDGVKDNTATQFYKPAETLVVGQSYSIEELVRRMIAYSDNNALATLLPVVDRGVLLRIYDDFGIDVPHVNSTVVPDYMTIRAYANIFRILHNSTYLNRGMSEKAMDILTTSQFAVGIEAGLPVGTPFAQKFGEYYAGPGTERELHDCGIVYAPKHAYLLCIFTKGSDYAQSARVMSELSKTVYQFVSTSL